MYISCEPSCKYHILDQCIYYANIRASTRVIVMLQNVNGLQVNDKLYTNAVWKTIFTVFVYFILINKVHVNFNVNILTDL